MPFQARLASVVRFRAAHLVDLIPLLIGVALLAYAYVLAPKIVKAGPQAGNRLPAALGPTRMVDFRPGAVQ